MSDPLTWVVGSRGLLGSAVARELRRQRRPLMTVEVPWSDPRLALNALDEAAGQMLAAGADWRVVWCAGAGVIGTSDQELQSELDVLAGFLDRFSERLTGPPAGKAAAQRGAFFLSSSAGGVYAGSGDAPFTEETAPLAISPYGEAKLAAEQLVEDFGATSGVATMVGRIANLYGPGQDVTKAQGLISQLCVSQLRRSPITIYVSLDTARDYLFVDDCARMVLRSVDHVARAGGQHKKILASGRSTTLGSLLGEMRRLNKRSPQVVLAASPLAKFQSRDLRFRSLAGPKLESEVSTTLPAGIAATMESLREGVRRGVLRS